MARIPITATAMIGKLVWEVCTVGPKKECGGLLMGERAAAAVAVDTNLWVTRSMFYISGKCMKCSRPEMSMFEFLC